MAPVVPNVLQVTWSAPAWANDMAGAPGTGAAGGGGWCRVAGDREGVWSDVIISIIVILTIGVYYCIM